MAGGRFVIISLHPDQHQNTRFNICDNVRIDFYPRLTDALQKRYQVTISSMALQLSTSALAMPCSVTA